MLVEGGRIANLRYHNRRLNLTRRHFWPDSPDLDLGLAITIPPHAEGCKARVVYGREGITELTFSPYSMRDIRTVRLVDGGDIHYEYKSTDRSALQRLAGQKDGCDEVLILRHGLVTDTSFTNVAFRLGSRWLTPQDPLLKGTRRQQLLDQGIIHQAEIHASDLPMFSHIRLFNAMVGFGAIDLPITSIMPPKACL